MKPPRTSHPLRPSSDILAAALAESASIVHKTNKALERQVVKISAELDDPRTNPVRVGECLRTLLEIQHALNGNVESLGRLLHKPIAFATPDTSVTPTSEDVLREIIQGKRSGQGKP